jgi:putative membrane protein
MKEEQKRLVFDLADKIILIFSALALGLLVYLVYFFPGVVLDSSENSIVTYIPFINACFNTLATLFILLGIRSISKRAESAVYIKRHKIFMSLAFVSSTCFLVGYLIYHGIHGDTKFLGQGIWRMIYFPILISHIILSAVAFPMVLLSFFWGVTGKISKHKKLARLTYPLWLYVSITGVIIFIMLKLSFLSSNFLS